MRVRIAMESRAVAARLYVLGTLALLANICAGQGQPHFLWKAGGHYTTLNSGRTWEVDAMEFSPDGKLVATCGLADGTVKLWDTATHELVRTIEFGTNAYDVAFSPDGERIAIVGNSVGQPLQLRRVSDGTLIGSAPLHGTANSVDFSADGRRLGVFASDVNHAYYVDADNLQVLRDHPIAFRCGALSRDGNYFAYSTPTQTVIMDPHANFVVRTTIPFGDNIFYSYRGLTFTADSASVAFPWTGIDGRKNVRMHSVSGSSEKIISSQDPNQTSYAISADGRRVAVGQRLGLADIVRVADRQPLVATQFSSPFSIVNLSYSLDGRTIGAVSIGHAEVRSALSFGSATNLLRSTYPVTGTSVSADGSIVGSTEAEKVARQNSEGYSYYGRVALRDGITGALHRTIEWDPGQTNPNGNVVYTVSLSSNGSKLAAAGVTNSTDTRKVRVYDVASGNILAYLQTSDNNVLMSPDGNYVMTWPESSETRRVWRASDGVQLYSVTAYGGAIFTMDSSEVVASHHGLLRVLAVATGAERLHRTFNAANAMAASPTGRYIGLVDGNILRMIRLDNLNEERSIQMSYVTGRIRFAGTDERVVVADGSSRIRFYSTVDASVLNVDGESRMIYSMDASRDGQVVAWGRQDGSAVCIQNPFANLGASIDSVVPQRSARVKPVLIRLGGNFDSGDEFKLRKSGQADIQPIGSTRFVNAWQLDADFDLRTAALGTYDIILTKSDGRVLRKPAAFEVVSGNGEGRLVARMEAIEVARADRDYVAYLTYSNEGTGVMPAPLLTVRSDRIKLRLSSKDKWSNGNLLHVLAIGRSPDAKNLYPGEYARIPIYFHTANIGQHQSIQVDEVTDISEEAYRNEWYNIRTQMDHSHNWGWYQPPPPPMYDAIWLAFISRYGGNASTHLSAVRATASWAADQGVEERDVTTLMSYAMSDATGESCPVSVLDAQLDASEITPGLPLQFVRFYMPSALTRFNPTPLGKGWWHNYQLRVEDRITHIDLETPGGGRRKFYPVPAADYWVGDKGDNATMIAASGIYHLIEKDGTRTSFGGPRGFVSTIADTNGNSLTFQYDGANKLTRIEHSNGKALTLSYNGANISEVHDSSGRWTQYIYDVGTGTRLDRTIAQPSGDQTSYGYHLGSELMRADVLFQVVYPDSTSRNFTYDDGGKLIRISPLVSTGDNRSSVRFEYGEQGTTKTKAADGNTWTMSKGVYGLPLSVSDPNGQTARVNYGVNLDPIRQISPRGYEWTAGFDTKGNQTESIDPLGNRLRMSYTTDGLNRLKELKDRRGNSMKLDTNIKGNVTRITYADLTHEDFQYDPAGNVSQWTNRRGQSVNYTYNDRGQLTGVLRPDGRIFTYGYDARGNLTSAADTVTGTITMQYNGRDYLARIDHPGGKWFEYDYTPDGRRTERRSSDGLTLRYAYDSIGRLEYLRDGNNAVIIRYEYDNVGRLWKEHKANGTVSEYLYDAASRVSEIKHVRPGGLTNFVYGYDADGNPTSVTGTRGSYTYSYDPMGQLTGATTPHGNQSFSYDAEGNRSTASGYQANSMNQYTNVGGDTRFEYDADGNMRRKFVNNVLVEEYTFDVENRMIGMTRGSEAWQYTYDALGNRVAVNHDGTTVNYVHDGASVAAEYAGANLQTRYVHALGLVARDDTNGAFFYDFDITGHTRQVTSPAGAVVNSYDYKPFGEMGAMSENVANPFRYVGRYGVEDDGNGLPHMRARVYSPTLGRFLSEDPIGLAGGDVNYYSYSFCSPIRASDPSGLTAADVGSPEEWNEIVGPAQRLPHQQIERVNKVRRFFDSIFMHFKLYRFVSNPAGTVAKDGAKHILKQYGPPGEGAAMGWSRFDELNRARDTYNRGQDVYRDINTPDGSIPPGRNGISEQVPGAFDPHYRRDPRTGLIIRVLGAVDPNEKRGPEGTVVEGVRYLPNTDEMEFTILFENKPIKPSLGGTNQIAHAQKVQIIDNLSPLFDWTTMQLQGITFANNTYSDLGGYQYGHLRVPIAPPTNSELVSAGQSNRDNSNLMCDITVTFDAGTGQLKWVLDTLDPLTEQEPGGVDQGILAPNGYWTGENFTNYGDGRGEGKVVFRIKLKEGVPQGTLLSNTASIIFDTNAPIITNPAWSAIFDASPPESHVWPLPTYSPSNFEVQWSGSDPGVGIATYNIYVSTNNGPYTLWREATGAGTATYTGIPGAKYRFYSLAKDKLGHTESPPSGPDATTLAGMGFAPAEGFTVTKGTLAGGTVEELQASDGKQVEVLTNPATQQAEIELTSSVPLTVPRGKFTFALESALAEDSGVQTIEFWDYTLSKWVVQQKKPIDKASRTVTLAGAGARYVSSEGVVKARVRCQSNGSRAVRYKLDAAVWNFAP